MLLLSGGGKWIGVGVGVPATAAYVLLPVSGPGSSNYSFLGAWGESRGGAGGVVGVAGVAGVVMLGELGRMLVGVDGELGGGLSVGGCRLCWAFASRPRVASSGESGAVLSSRRWRRFLVVCRPLLVIFTTY